IFVSATLQDEIMRLARQSMTDPVEVNVSRDNVTVNHIEQFCYSVEPWDKYRLLEHLLKVEAPKLAIVFTNTKREAHKISKRLNAFGIESREIHGDLVQAK